MNMDRQGWLCRLQAEGRWADDGRGVIKVLTVSTGTPVAGIRSATLREHVPPAREDGSESLKKKNLVLQPINTRSLWQENPAVVSRCHLEPAAHSRLITVLGGTVFAKPGV